MAPDAVDLSRIRRALVVKLRHHGDVLLASPVFGALKSQWPDIAIDALVYDDTRDMLALHPAIRRVHTVGRNWRRLGPGRRIAAEWKLLRDLRAARYELLIHLTEHPRGAWLARTLGVLASVAPRRDGAWWRTSFTHCYPTVGGGRRHTVETNLDALRRIGMYPAPSERRLFLDPGEDAVVRMDGVLAQAGFERSGFIQVHPASRWRFKCWTEGSMAALIDALQNEGHRVVVTGSSDARERSFVDRVLALCRRAPVSLAGSTSLKDLAALTRRARMFIGVDSAPMHIAAAVGTPTIALFGPSGEIEWGPWLVPHLVVSSAQHPCRPCGLDGCGGGKISDCLTSIEVQDVLRAVQRLHAMTV